MTKNKQTHHTDTISITWHYEDVQDIRPHLNAAQARAVLYAADRNHDANIGINWDVLAYHADDMFPNTQPENGEAG